ncbi:MAG TPA: YlmC/YmxH family sporulation protein [Clostridia bacterium]|nr:YlmC/YmxH family sporulation protein [Clostridia bacterium]
MACKFSELKRKDVINICDGSILGCIIDMIICVPEGYIEAIIVPGCPRSLNFFKQRHDIVIPWYKITKIGDDVILVELEKGSVNKPFKK